MTGLAKVREVSDSAQLYNADRFATLPALPGLPGQTIGEVLRN
jgi:hypothetical protein